jgi:hypothetical protein
VSGFRSSHLVRFNACCVVSVPRVFAACCGTGRMLHRVCGVCAVLRAVCRGQCFAHAAACALPAARRTGNEAVPCVSLLHLACYRVLLHIVCCLLHVVRCTLSVVFSTLPVVCCVLHAACSTLHAALRVACRCCSLRIARCMAHVVWMLSVARVSSGGQVHFPRCMLHVVCYTFPDACCMSSFVCCTFSSGRLRHCCPLDRVCVPFLCCMSHVLRCMWSDFCCPHPRVPCSMVCAVCRPTRVASRRVARCMTHALCRMLSLVRCLSRLACRLLHVVCCVLQSDSEPSCSQRIASAPAI